MSLPSARPCQSSKCSGIIVWLANRSPKAKNPWIAVDVSSLSEEEKERIHFAKTSREIDYDPRRHVSHWKSCLDRDRFRRPEKKSPEKKPEPKKKPEQRVLFNNRPRIGPTWD